MFYDKFKTLCERKGVSCTKAAVQMGLSNATPTKWKKTGATPDGATLAKIAAYFEVSIETLLDQENNSSEPGKIPPAFTRKDERDIEKILAAAREQLENQEGLMFDGDPASPEAVESILSAMELGLQAAKMRNKEKYTPKKYRQK